MHTLGKVMAVTAAHLHTLGKVMAVTSPFAHTREGYGCD